MATVYLAVQESLSRQVALKVMSPALFHDPTFKERFSKEGQIIAKLNHPGIVTVHDIGLAGDRYYIAMEYVEGRNLKERIRDGVTVEDSVHTVKRVAQALGFAHRLGFIHRDIKPENILFREDRYAVLTDFGIAKALSGGTNLTTPGMSLGTPSYMSPEQAVGKKLDGRSDIYSLGVLFFEMLAGHQPYGAPDGFSMALQHLREPVPELPSDVAMFQPVINQAMAKKPEERFASGEDLILALDEIIAADNGETLKPPQVATVALNGTSTKTQRQPHAYALLRRAATDTPSGWVAQSRTLVRRSGARRWIGGVSVALVLLSMVVWLFWLSPLDSRTRAALELLHTTAKVQIKASRLIDPPGDNALETYRQILAIYPEDRQAKAALEKLAVHYQSIARNQLEQSNFIQGLALVEKGLLIDPDQSALLDLKKTSERRIEAQRQRREIAALLRKAESQFGASQLIEPPNDNAFKTYNQVLTIDNHNTQALQGIQKIAQRFEQDALAKFDAGDFQACLSLIEQGLKVDPNHKNLNALRDQAHQHIEAKKRQTQIAQWLAQAHRQLETEQWVSPPGDNAFDTFKQILAVDANNRPALDGLRDIVSRIEKAARAEQQQGRLEQGIALLDEGLKAYPSEPRLKQLHTELEQLQQRKLLQRKLTTLLSQAGNQLKQGKLVQPPDDNAEESYHAVLSIQADNQEAEAGLLKIAEYYRTRAEAARQASNFDAALSAITLGLKAVADDAKLLTLRDEVKAQLANTRRREQLLAELRTRVNAQLAAGHFTEPAGDNANETYAKILELEPQDAKAEAGLDSMAHRFEQQARASLKDGEYAKSLSFIEEGLTVRAGQPDLLALRKQVNAGLRRRGEQQRIEALLQQSERQLGASRLDAPRGDNALESYREILKLNANEQRARLGIQKIADHYLREAKHSQSAGDLQASLEWIEKGLHALPEHAELTRLKTQISQASNRKQRERFIQTMLTKAQQQIDHSQLTSPKANNAYETYSAVLQQDPQNPQAIAGLSRIADRYQQLALAHKKKGDLRLSITMVTRGLSVDPQHADLLALKQELENELEKTDKILELLSQAQKQLESNRLENAYETYQRVQKLDQNNRNARLGIDAIADRYEAIAREDMNSKLFDQALKNINSGRNIDPNHPGLISLLQALAARKLENPPPPQVPSGSAEEPEQVPEKEPVLAPFGGTF